MGILLGLLTALTWGGADFVARFATHRIGALRSMLYMQLTGFLLLSSILQAFGSWGHLADGSGWQPWAWGFLALAGSFNAVSGLALYRAFEIGKMSVVAPLSASYPALTLLLSWMTGERLSMMRIVGIFCTLVGVVVVAGGEKTPDENDAEAVRRSGRGIGLAMFSAVGFAVLFWLLGVRVIPRVGAIQTVWMIRLTSTLITSTAILIVGVFDTGAFILSNLGMKMEQVAVITVLSSLYGAVTVGLAAIFLREHVSRWQWAGIVTIFTGIFLISR